MAQILQAPPFIYNPNIKDYYSCNFLDTVLCIPHVFFYPRVNMLYDFKLYWILRLKKKDNLK